MRVETQPGGRLPEGLDTVGVPVHRGDDGPVLAMLAMDKEPVRNLPGLTSGLDGAWCRRHRFEGKVGQTIRIGPGAPEVVLVGLGSAAELTGDRGIEAIRRASAAFVRAAGRSERAGWLLSSSPALDSSELAAAAAEGAVLGSYRYDTYRTAEAPGGLETIVLVGGSPDDGTSIEEGAERGARLAESVCLARDLVNEPPSSLTPERFAERFVERFAGVAGLTIEVWDEQRIAEERLGGLLGVARGSVQPPRLVKVEYHPPTLEQPDEPAHLALVGKGITFDSGGLSLKTATGMETMKTDMGGAAAVLAAVDAVAALGSALRLTAFTPLTENMPSGSATKPGDVLTARNGKTIEVLNTDAEGRLVLADGLSLAAEAEPDAIVDLATLTGAAVVALGKDVAALLGNDGTWLAEVEAAGERAGEALWRLPLPDDYRSHIDSEVADMRNVGRPGQAGTIAAALLLREFVGNVPWAHLDIAGPSRAEENGRYLTKGGTGFGVRTLVSLITSPSLPRLMAARRAEQPG